MRFFIVYCLVMADDAARSIARQVLKYVEQLQNSRIIPEIPEAFADDADFLKYHKKIVELRSAILALAKGDLYTPITAKGYLAGACKSLQASLRHMTWKVSQIKMGDYEQRLDFLGELSASFNSMVTQLKITTENLRQKEEALTVLAASLQKEARRRSDALQELRKSEQRFKYLAQRDPLTGLFNRRAFFSLAEMSLAYAAAVNQACCVCMLDVDNFKKFNDRFGHLEGDRALQHVVKCGQGALRQADIMGRYGGEEFLFLFADTDEAQGYAAGERIRLAIERSVFSLENGGTTALTVSIGVAVILPGKQGDDYGQTLRQGIAQVDAALYQAKAQEKNRVCLAR
ncbi:MAG: GGDEF domain-containing protein [Deltaproteobacteria bacterium]|nr:GGDEF domain-containing protein [Deltaproteobacteria bacterium]